MQEAAGLPARVRSLASVWTALGTILTGTAFLVLFRQLLSPWLQDHMSGGELLDLMYWRTPGDLNAALDTYGTDGRNFYRNVLLVDLLFPIVYSIPLSLSMAFVADQFVFSRRFVRLAAIIPLVGGMFDWGENILLWIQTGRFPDQSEFLGWIACAMTALKFALVFGSVLIVFVGLIAYGILRILSRHGTG